MKLERLISGGGAIIFRGSGFYETDYRSKDYTQKAEAEKKAANADGEPTKKSDSKAETKPTKNAGGDAKPSKSESAKGSKSEAAKAGAKK